ncbi:MAG: hypothetical protein EZS28_014921 [Streblomastix strix]|uniref:Uncharacterized protein n=1 Tax=Streblomastix strix TaxID=222440 RepID=A0A5J4W3J5_9EUKA|nr:MAG: hypothetical protein EZS28_014921 [Streblomastix strix]
MSEKKEEITTDSANKCSKVTESAKGNAIVKKQLSEQQNIMNIVKSISTSTQIENLDDSQSETENENLLKVKLLYNHIDHIKKDKLVIEINNNICSELLQHIVEGKTKVQQELLQVVLLIAIRGADMTERLEMNKFYESFHKSGLLRKIEEILLHQIELQSNDDLFSQLQQLIILIYSFMNKCNEIDLEILEKCGMYFKIKIVELNQKLNQYLVQKVMNENEQKEIDIVNVQRMMKEGAQLIKAISALTIDSQNQQYFNSELELHKDIVNLIHICCPKELNCLQRININESEAGLELVGNIFGALGDLSWCEKQIQKFLLDEHKKTIKAFQFINVLIEAIGTGSGSEEEENKIIRSDIYEDIEEQEGSEEVATHLFHNIELKKDKVQSYSRSAIYEIFNCFQYRTY